MHLFVHSLDPITDPVLIFSTVRHKPFSLFLDSADENHPQSRYSFVLFDPVETISAKNGIVTITNADQNLSFKACPFETVRQRLALRTPQDTEIKDTLPPFRGGAAGFFGYDLVRGIETLPQAARDAPSVPDMMVGIYDQVVAFDHEKQRLFFIVVAADEEASRVRFDALRKQIQDVKSEPEKNQTAPVWGPVLSADAYKNNVQKVIDYIHAGDLFQANLSQRFSAALPHNFDPFMHYRIMRRINPAPFASYMNAGNITISSASPERFLHVRNRQVETRPIKGTRPRLSVAANDETMRRALMNSEKDRAENIMIVDLLRNDLSRTCEDHSVDVTDLCALESFAGVHHLVSTIRGTLRADKTPFDLLKTCFPGGSITGAPKIRAMEIIEELELERRGPYCGSIGYIGFDGSMDSNILIRTLVYDSHTVTLNTGGGITAASVPEEEYRETIDKAAIILRSFEEKAAKDAAKKASSTEEQRRA